MHGRIHHSFHGRVHGESHECVGVEEMGRKQRAREATGRASLEVPNEGVGVDQHSCLLRMMRRRRSVRSCGHRVPTECQMDRIATAARLRAMRTDLHR